jgi:hypothetical protein
MMHGAITDDQARALAALVASLHPGWDVPGVRVAIHKARHRGDAFAVARAALEVASRVELRTPALLAEDGPHWGTSTQVPRPQQARCVVHPFELADPCRECRAEELAAGEASPGPSISPEQAARNVAGARLVRAAGSRPLDVRERAAGETGDE